MSAAASDQLLAGRLLAARRPLAISCAPAARQSLASRPDSPYTGVALMLQTRGGDAVAAQQQKSPSATSASPLTSEAEEEAEGEGEAGW